MCCEIGQNATGSFRLLSWICKMHLISSDVIESGNRLMWASKSWIQEMYWGYLMPSLKIVADKCLGQPVQMNVPKVWVWMMTAISFLYFNLMLWLSKMLAQNWLHWPKSEINWVRKKINICNNLNTEICTDCFLFNLGEIMILIKLEDTSSF